MKFKFYYFNITYDHHSQGDSGMKTGFYIFIKLSEWMKILHNSQVEAPFRMENLSESLIL